MVPRAHPLIGPHQPSLAELRRRKRAAVGIARQPLKALFRTRDETIEGACYWEAALGPAKVAGVMGRAVAWPMARTRPPPVVTVSAHTKDWRPAWIT
jgi:hypothetical protein